MRGRMRRVLGGGTAAAVLAAAWASPAVAQEPAKTPTARGTGGAAATVDALASQAAIEMLRDGGNAVDAAVAAAAVKRGSSGGDAAEPARLSGLLEWVGRRSDQDLGRALKRLQNRMEPLLTLLFGGMIALILICLYYPVFNLGNVVS